MRRIERDPRGVTSPTCFRDEVGKREVMNTINVETIQLTDMEKKT